MKKEKEVTGIARIPRNARGPHYDPILYEKWFFTGIGGCGGRLLAKLYGKWFSHSHKKKFKLHTEDVFAIDTSRYNLSLLLLNRKNRLKIGRWKRGFGSRREVAKEFMEKVFKKGNKYLFNIDAKLEDDLNKGIISEDLKRVFKTKNFPLSRTVGYLFSWDNVPGNDSERLLRFLWDDLDIGWVENAEIRKSDDGKTISISKDENSAEIMIDEKKEKATLKISDDRTFDLEVKKVNDKLKLYKAVITIEKDIKWLIRDRGKKIFVRKEDKKKKKLNICVNDVTSKLKELGIENSDACLLITSLGGGTGSGGNQILSEKIKTEFEDVNIPLVILGVLPFYWESHIFHDNSIKAMEEFGENSNSNNSSDLLIIVDNSILVHDRIRMRYINDKIAEIVYRLTSPRTFPYGKMLDVEDIIQYTSAEGKNVIFPAFYYPVVKKEGEKSRRINNESDFMAEINKKEFVKEMFKNSAMLIFPEEERAREMIKSVLIYIYIPERLKRIAETQAHVIVDRLRERLEGLDPTVFFVPTSEGYPSIFSLCTIDLEYVKEEYKKCWYSGKKFKDMVEEREKAINKFFE